MDKYSLLFHDTDNYLNLPDSFVFYISKIKIKKFHFIISEKDFNNDNNNEDIENNNEVLDFYLEDTIYHIFQKNMMLIILLILKILF